MKFVPTLPVSSWWTGTYCSLSFLRSGQGSGLTLRVESGKGREDRGVSEAEGVSVGS